MSSPPLMHPEPIIPASYWVTGSLAAGQYPGTKDPEETTAKLARFVEAGISTFVDLTHRRDRLEPYEHLLTTQARLHFPITDDHVPSTAEMTTTLDAIDRALEHGETVYVHCWGGHGRTGTVIGCWLVRHGATSEEAIALIRERRQAWPVLRANPLSPQTASQHAFVHAWPPPG